MHIIYDSKVLCKSTEMSDLLTQYFCVRVCTHVCYCKHVPLLLSARVKCLSVKESILVINLHLRFLVIRTASHAQTQIQKSALLYIELGFNAVPQTQMANGIDLGLTFTFIFNQTVSPCLCMYSLTLSHLLFCSSVSLLCPITSCLHSLTLQHFCSLYFCRGYANTPASSRSHSLLLFVGFTPEVC